MSGLLFAKTLLYSIFCVHIYDCTYPQHITPVLFCAVYSNVNKESNETECYNAHALMKRRCNFSDDSVITKDYHSGKLGEHTVIE